MHAWRKTLRLSITVPIVHPGWNPKPRRITGSPRTRR